jgi:hypothetical protein
MVIRRAVGTTAIGTNNWYHPRYAIVHTRIILGRGRCE